jgi:hypothetical protein
MTQDLEKTLWANADKLHNNMDAAEYKHIVLGLIFLKYIYDRFFLYISATENSEELRLLLKVAHSSTIHSIKGYLSIKSIVLISNDKTLTLPINLGTISGNNTQHSSFTMGFGMRPFF